MKRITVGRRLAPVLFDMAITVERLVELRPWAFHTTTPINFAAIRIWRRLRSAADLLTGTDYEHLLRLRRLETIKVTVDGVPVEIRDQRPLQIGHIRFEDNFTVADLLAELNTRVFFWLGDEGGPRQRGKAHFKRYQSIGEVVVLRCPLRELLTVNGNGRAYVSAFNSGAPRSNPISGHVVRGRTTFQLLEQASVGNWCKAMLHIAKIPWGSCLVPRGSLQ